MPLRFLLDENVPAKLRHAIDRHNLSGESKFDVLSIGDLRDLPLGSDDPTILRWAERDERILITEDKRTMSRHLARHLDAGNHTPGIFLIRPSTSVPRLVEFLMLVAHASGPEEWRDWIEYIP